jgi:hypothetical protein
VKNQEFFQKLRIYGTMKSLVRKEKEKEIQPNKRLDVISESHKKIQKEDLKKTKRYTE